MIISVKGMLCRRRPIPVKKIYFCAVMYKEVSLQCYQEFRGSFLFNSHTDHGIFFNLNLQTFLVFMKHDTKFEKFLVFWLSNRIHSIPL